MFIIVLIMVSLASANPLDERAHMLLHAKNSKTLKAKINSMENLKRAAAACDFELTHHQVPKSCYSLKLTAEKKEVVDQACERATFKMVEPVKTGGLSKTCAEFVNKKNKDIQYSQSESDPGQFLR